MTVTGKLALKVLDVLLERRIRQTNTIFPAARAFEAVVVWTNNANDQGGGEAVKKPNGWRRNVKRAASVNGSSASSAECR